MIHKFQPTERICKVCGSPFTATFRNNYGCCKKHQAEYVKRRLSEKTCVCKICGKEFHPQYYGNKKYCSKACYNAAVELRYKKEVRYWKKKCRVCGKEFVTTRSASRLCDDCAREDRKRRGIEEKVTLVCATCGIEFEGYKKTDDNGHEIQQYCSQKCKRKAELKEHGTFICKVCGKPFEPKRIDAVCCSKECKKKLKDLQRKAWTDRRSKARAKRHVVETRKCEFCGKPFTFDSYLHNKRFCSDVCKRKAETRTRSENTEFRADKFSITVAENTSSLLDEYRERKGAKYFKILKTLPEAEQIKEMESWTPDDHCAYLASLGTAVHVAEESPDDENDAIPSIRQEEPGVYDEEDHTRTERPVFESDVPEEEDDLT